MVMKLKEHGYALCELNHVWQGRILQPNVKVILKCNQFMVFFPNILGWQHKMVQIKILEGLNKSAIGS